MTDRNSSRTRRRLWRDEDVDVRVIYEPMKFLLPITLITAVIASGTAASAETGRIRRKPPDVSEAARIASETIMNDSLLQKGDIVVTDRGFFVFRGVASDGYTYEFSPVLNPVSIAKPSR